MVSPYEVRIFGDPVLRKVAEAVEDIDGKLVALANDMLETMYNEPGIGLAAPQVGVQKRFFVYDLGDGSGADALINPIIRESDGEAYMEEGCLSVPGLHWEILRPAAVEVHGYNLNGEEVTIEADGLMSRLIQHEFDHLEGILLVDRLDDDDRKKAMKVVREKFILPQPEPEPKKKFLGGLRLP